MYGASALEAVVIHRFAAWVNPCPALRFSVQVIDLQGGFCCNRGFPEFSGAGFAGRREMGLQRLLAFWRARPHEPAPQLTHQAEDLMKRTYQASKVRRARTHGFLVRMKTRGGRAVINARRAKGRKRLAV